MTAGDDVFAVVRLTRDRTAEVIDVLSDAFHDYPVMTYTANTTGSEYDRLLRLMVEVFTASRFLRDYPVLAATNQRDEILAVAHINPPRGIPFPPELERLYAELGTALGPEGNARLARLSETWNGFEGDDPHYHLGMIGTQHAHQGNGHGGRLIKTLHKMSRDDPGSSGVSLTTEDPKNVALYQHLGYEIVGHERFDGIETWGFFRKDDE